MAKAKNKKRSQGNGILMLVLMLPFRLLIAALGLIALGFAKIMPSRAKVAEVSKRHTVRRGALIAGIILVCGLGLFFMRLGLQGQERFSIDPRRIQLSEGELTWLRGPALERVQQIIDRDVAERLRPLQASHAFDQDILAAVHQAVASSPWVSSVERVERRFPGENTGSSLCVVAHFRKPILKLVKDGKLYFVDRDRFILPLVIETDAAGNPLKDDDRVFIEHVRPSLRTVYGVREISTSGLTQIVAGHRSSNEQVVAAVEVEGLLRAHNIDAWCPIEAMNVRDVSPRRDYRDEVAYAAGGGVRLHSVLSASPLVWGKVTAQGHADVAEVGPERKFARLAEVLKGDPALEHQDVYYLNRLSNNE